MRLSQVLGNILAVLFLSVGPLLAQDVRLTSRDGGVEVSGRLVEFDGAFYQIETEFGTLTVDAAGVTCEGADCPADESGPAELTIGGSPELGSALFASIVEAFARDRGYTSRREITGDLNFDIVLSAEAGEDVGRLQFRIGDMEESAADLGTGQIDFLVSDQILTGSEGLIAQRFGSDALMAVVSPGNHATMISQGNLRAVLAGTITNWGEMGGPDLPISVHVPDAANPLSEQLSARLYDGAEPAFGSEATQHLELVDLVDAVAADPFALGITRYSERGNTRALAIAGSCGFEIAPSRIAIKTGDYPQTMSLLIYTRDRRLPPLARDLQEYIVGPQAQAILRLGGYVDLLPETEVLGVQGNRLINAVSLAGVEVPVSELRRMAGILRGAERVSVSFRFEPGSTILDAASASNVVRLAEALEAGVYDGKTVRFVGFSDGVGAADGNRRIGAGRAEAVLAAVNEAAVSLSDERVVLATESFGEAMPLACDADDWGRDINRRVEVWVR